MMQRGKRESTFTCHYRHVTKGYYTSLQTRYYMLLQATTIHTDTLIHVIAGYYTSPQATTRYYMLLACSKVYYTLLQATTHYYRLLHITTDTLLHVATDITCCCVRLFCLYCKITLLSYSNVTSHKSVIVAALQL